MEYRFEILKQNGVPWYLRATPFGNKNYGNTVFEIDRLGYLREVRPDDLLSINISSSK